MENATTRAIDNNLAIQNAIQQVVADTRRARPKNTSKNYDSKQLEWLSWCATKGFADGNLVYEGKLLLYLREVVVPRGSGKRVSGVVQPLSADGLEGYVKAIVDLYSTQQSLGLNRDPHPRGKALKGYLHNLKQQHAQRKRIEYLDRGEGTVQDTYSQDELRRIANHFFAKNNGRGLRDRLDLLLGHAIMARGESTVATLLEKRRCDRRMTLDRLMKDLKKRGPSAVSSTAP